MYLRDLFKTKSLSFITYAVACLILLSTVLFFYFTHLQQQVNKRKGDLSSLSWKAERLKNDITVMESFSQRAVLKRDDITFNQYDEAIQTATDDRDSLVNHLRNLSVEDGLVPRVNENINRILKGHKQFLATVRSGDSAEVVLGINQLQSDFQLTGSVLTGVSESNEFSGDTLGGVTVVLKVLQILLLLSVPFLIVLVFIHKRNEKKLLLLNRDIEESNRKYVFNALDEVNYDDAELIKSRLLGNLKKASEFIQQVADGNYAIRWEGITDANRDVNQDNIAGELIRMREQMKQVKAQDEMRIWTTEGLSMFGELIRKHQDNFESLADNFISNAVKYLKAKVGGLFVLEEESDGKQHLSLKASYAYERKKFITKSVNIGEGLVGQSFLEGHTIYLKEVPNEYISITSGLGGANPRCLVVVPLKTNERIEGVIEIASFEEFKTHEIEFLEKLAEQLASSVISVRTAEKTKTLLESSQQQSEEMRAQEEEMRQNMEELEATQEQMQRQMNELNTLKHTLEREQYLFGSLMASIPDAIYFKDEQSKFLRVSDYLAKQFDAREADLIGKSDFDFHDDAHAKEAFDDEMNIMRTRQPKIDYVEKEVRDDGSEHYVSTTKMPLVNLQGEVVGTFGISRDVSKLKNLENSLRKKEQLLVDEEQQHKLKIKQLEEALKEAQIELERLRGK